MNYILINTGLPIISKIYEKQPIGGSELSLLLYGEKLALENINNNVFIFSFNISNHKDEILPNLNFINLNDISKYISIGDVFIFNRHYYNLELLKYIKLQLNRKTILYCHDAYDQQFIYFLFDKFITNELFDEIYCVSNWQKETYIQYFNIDKNKIKIMPNISFKKEWILGYDKKIYDFIFASIPYKGLYVLEDIMNEIIYKTKLTDLKFVVMSDYNLYQRNNDQEYIQYIHKLQYHPNFIIKQLSTPTQLQNILKQSRFYIHPSTYHETFGMVVVQAQANGCIPIAINNGALNEIIIHKYNGLLTNGKTIYNKDTFNEYIELICSILFDSELEKKLRLNAEQSALQYAI